MSGDWSAQKERSNPITLRLICNFAQLMPRSVTRLWLWPIALYFYFFAPGARAASRQYLKRMPGIKGNFFQVMKHIHTFASVILDRVYFLTDKFEKFEIDIKGGEVLDSVLSKGNGAIMLGAHIGSFEAMRCLALRHAHLPLKIMMYHNHNAMITRILEELNPEVAQSVINLENHTAIFEAKEALEQGYMIGLLGDRVLTGEKSIQCVMLGGEVELAYGPLALAMMLGVPIIIFFGVYEGGNKYSIHHELLWDGQKVSREQRSKMINVLAYKYVKCIENILEQFPYNWFNFYNYWNDSE